MTLHASKSDQQSSQKVSKTIPDFKPVALPAVAGAMCSAKSQPTEAKTPEPPAILRKEAMPGH